MQTFLPYPDFAKSAQALDYKRLGKQRVETKQIYLALTDPTYGWQNHPAVTMWRGYKDALAIYGLEICNEWLLRGYNDTLLDWFEDRLPVNYSQPKDIMPKWLGDQSFHLSHQSNLVRKDAGYYSHQFPGVPNDLPYVWPTNL